MSVKLMNMVFEAKIENAKVGEKTVTAPLLKLVMLALADHCNDDGDGAYPSLTMLEKKTALTRKSVINSLDALKQQGAIFRVGISKRGTTNYSLNIPMLKSLVFQTEIPLFASEPGTPPEQSASEPGTPTEQFASEPGSCASEPGSPEPSLTKESTTTTEPNIFKIYESNFGLLIPMIADALKDAEQTYPAEWIKAAMTEAVTNNKRNWKYVEAILKRWLVDGPDTPKPKSTGGDHANSKYTSRPAGKANNRASAQRARPHDDASRALQKLISAERKKQFDEIKRRRFQHDTKN